MARPERLQPFFALQILYQNLLRTGWEIANPGFMEWKAETQMKPGDSQRAHVNAYQLQKKAHF